MTVDQQNPKTKTSGKKSSRSFHKSDLVVPLFIFAGFGATYVSCMTVVASIYDPQGHAIGRLVTFYAAPLLFLPCFLVALLRRRWMSFPLWLCSFAMLLIGFIHSHQPANAGPFRPSIGILFIPALVQVARLFRGQESAGGR
jgi:hypothetical protein